MEASNIAIIISIHIELYIDTSGEGCSQIIYKYSLFKCISILNVVAIC